LSPDFDQNWNEPTDFNRIPMKIRPAFLQSLHGEASRPYTYACITALQRVTQRFEEEALLPSVPELRSIRDVLVIRLTASIIIMNHHVQADMPTKKQIMILHWWNSR
jgi:hypothetical protein